MAPRNRPLARHAAHPGHPHELPGRLVGRLRDGALARFGTQLGHPHGVPGRLVGRLRDGALALFAAQLGHPHELPGRLVGRLRDGALARFAAQLGHPHGVPGRLVGRMLNRANRAATFEAVDALDLAPGAVVADLGFGGGIGLELLLRRLGDRSPTSAAGLAGGQVHGVDQSVTMLGAAARRFRREIETGRLALHQASIECLPLAAATVDGAITLNTLYFITDLAGALQECARVLKPSGQLVVGLGDPNQMARQRVTAHGFRVRPLAEVTNALLAAGLEVDEHRPIGNGRGLFHLLVAQPY